MKSQDLLEQLISESNWSKSRLASALGFNNPQGFQKRFSKGVAIKVGFLTAVLSKLNYQLVVVPEGSKLPQGSFVVEDDFSLRKDAGVQDD